MKRHNDAEHAVTNRSTTTTTSSRSRSRSGDAKQADIDHTNNFAPQRQLNNSQSTEKRTRSYVSSPSSLRMEEQRLGNKTTNASADKDDDDNVVRAANLTNQFGNHYGHHGYQSNPHEFHAHRHQQLHNHNINYQQQQQQQQQRPAQVVVPEEEPTTATMVDIVASDQQHHHHQNSQQQISVATSIHDECDDDDDDDDCKRKYYDKSTIQYQSGSSHPLNQQSSKTSNNRNDDAFCSANNSNSCNTVNEEHVVDSTQSSSSSSNNNQTTNTNTASVNTSSTTKQTTTSTGTTTNHPVVVVAAAAATDRATSQDYYFDSYAHHAIHEEMLKDEVRTKTYEMAICQNKHLFDNKIVLDVGCGTGILSMFAARAGAKHIYAVDCSSIIVQAQNIVNINGLADKITLIRGKVEEIDLPVDTVDIIISEWMGYFLLYESMLDTVLFARDKWLVKKNGIIFPDKAVMYISAIEDGQVRRDRFDYWDDVYGFDMSPIKDIALREPVVDVVDAKALVTDGVPILSLDILTCTKDDLNFTSCFKLQALRNDYIHGLVAYFECAFTQIHKPIGFSTSPMARYTHWKQTILYLPETLTVCAGEVLMGEISCQPNERNRRDLDIGLTLTFKGRYSEFDKEKIPYRLR